MLRLEKLRNELGLSQNDLAKKLNMTQQRISSYEKGKREPDLETLKLLADFFDVSTDYLLNKSDIRNPEKQEKFSTFNCGELDLNGLDAEDIIELQKQIDYIKKLKKQI